MSDESFCGFMARLSEANDYPLSRWILNLAGIKLSHPSSEHSIAFQQDLVGLSAVARLIGLDVSKLLALTYPPAITEQHSRLKHLFWGLPVRKQVISLQQSKICPACLRESAYCRRLWDLVPVTTCHFHKCLLVDACPKCNKSITWARKYVCYCPCGFDWRDSPSEILEDSELEAGHHIHNLCNRTRNTGGEALNPKVDPLLELNLDDYIAALLLIAGQHVGVGTGKGHHIASSKQYPGLHSLITRAFLVFKNWPYNFHQFLDWRRSSRQSNSTTGTGLEKEFGRFHYLLHRFLFPPSFDFMRVAYNDYVNLRRIRRRSKHAKSLSVSKPNKRYISKSDVMIRLGVDGSIVDQLIQYGKLDCIVKKKKRPRYLIEVSSLEKVQSELPNRVTLGNAANILGMTSEKVLELVRNGSLPPPLEPFTDDYRRWGFSRSALNTYLSDTMRLQPSKN